MSVKNIHLLIVCACVILSALVLGSFFADREHNRSVGLIRSLPLKVYGHVADALPNSKITKTEYEFEYSGKTYRGNTQGNYYFSTGDEICIDFYQNDPRENVYCVENKTIPLNYILFYSEVLLIAGLLVAVSIWKRRKMRGWNKN